MKVLDRKSTKQTFAPSRERRADAERSQWIGAVPSRMRYAVLGGAILALGMAAICGCGGGSSSASSQAGGQQASRPQECDVVGAERDLEGIEAEIVGTKTRLHAALAGKKYIPSPEPGAARQSIQAAGFLALRTMEENVSDLRKVLQSC